jgi:hypothetical protein
MSRRVWLDQADRWCHRTCDWYIDTKPLGHHLPGWGRLQLWQWYLCNAYERAAWPEDWQ